MKDHKSKAASKTSWPPQCILNPGKYHKWSREVVFDFHEVCVKWLEPFCKFYNASYGTNINPDDLDSYQLQFLPGSGVRPEQFKDAFVTFCRLAKGGYGDLEPFKGIKETMEAIRAAGIKIQIWTWTPAAADIKPDGASAYNTGIAQNVTKQLISRLKLPIDVDRDVQFMHPQQKQWAMAEQHIPLIVEDNKTTACDVADASHAVILVPKKYNEDFVCRNVLRLSTRKELAKAVIKFYKKLDQAGVLQ